jgi:hypothetical protein
MKFNLKIFYVLIFISNLSFGQSDENDKLFNTDVVTNVIKSDSINLDDYKGLILIPGGGQLETYFKKIDYFDKIQSFKDFEKEIKKSELKKEIGDFWGKDGFINAYSKYKKFLCLMISQDRKSKTVKMSLYKPDTKEMFTVVGKLKVQYIGYSAGNDYVEDSTYESMLNELVKYIKQNSKTYMR